MGYPTPETLPTTVICRQLFIPDDPVFIGAFTGALLDLIAPTQWEPYGAITPVQAAEAALAILTDYLNSTGDCMQCCPLRINAITGRLQQSPDGGETWEDVPQAGDGGADDPAVQWAEPSPVLGADKPCNAAASAGVVLKQFYVETFLAFQNTITNTVLDIAQALASLAEAFGGLIGLEWSISLAQDAWEADEQFTSGGFTETVEDELRCILYCNATENEDETVSFDYEAIRTEIGAKYAADGSPWGALNALLWFIGEAGLNHAGGVPVITDANCADCDCTNAWCYTFDFTGGSAHGWTFANNSAGSPFGSAASGGIMYGDLRDPATTGSAFRRIVMERSFPFSATLTRILVEYDYTFGGDGSSGTVFIDTRVDNVTVQSFTRQNIIDGVFNPSGTGGTQEWTGEVLDADSVRLDWSARIDSTSPYTYSGNVRIKTVTLEGTGDNPFGSDNCG